MAKKVRVLRQWTQDRSLLMLLEIGLPDGSTQTIVTEVGLDQLAGKTDDEARRFIQDVIKDVSNSVIKAHEAKQRGLEQLVEGLELDLE